MSWASRSRTRPRLPLAGIRVVALEQAVAAPLCTRHLADLGADVVKVERPDGGDFARGYDSIVRGLSAHFVWLNYGKRSVALDLKRDEDRRALDDLLAEADVFVHNLGPGAVERLGLGWPELHARWPRLISCSISGYGLDGPYRDRKAFDLLLQGEAGVISVTGSADAPAKVAIPVADIAGGLYALAAILAALHERRRTRAGRAIDISLLECLAEWMSVPTYVQRYAGRAPERTGLRHSMVVPYGPYRVGDGSLVNIAVQTDEQWRRFCAQVLERPELAEHASFRTNELRVQHRAELEPMIEVAFAELTRASVLGRLEQADVPYGALNSVADVLAHPQLHARGRWVEVGSPSGALWVVAHPMNLDGMPRPSAAVPGLGEHTEDVLGRARGRKRP